MKTIENTYDIQKGDTLQKVAQELSIAPQELRRYHNIYCEVSDLIEADFPSHLKTLLLAPIKNEATENIIIKTKPRKVSFVNENTLPFLPAGTQKKYKVHYELENGEEKDTIDFEASVKWIAVDPNGFHFFEIDRVSKTQINNAGPDMMLEELAVKTAEVLYPLQIVVDFTGNWVDVHNYKQILERWENTKQAILDYYEGELTQIHIKHTEESLSSKNLLMESLRSDLFLRAIFNGVNVDYTKDLTFENNITFPLVKGEEALYNVEQKVFPILEEDKWIKIEQKGNYIDTDFDIDYGFDPWEGNYNATYFLNPNTYCLEKMDMECSIHYDSAIKTTITIEELKPMKVGSANDENATNKGVGLKKENFFSILTSIFNEPIIQN